MIYPPAHIVMCKMEPRKYNVERSKLFLTVQSIVLPRSVYLSLSIYIYIHIYIYIYTQRERERERDIIDIGISE